MATPVIPPSEDTAEERDWAVTPEASVRLTADQVETLILETIQRDAESLLRTARRHSLCADDAQEAYQRAMEIFLRRAATLDPPRAAAWLNTVTKHEAMAVRRQRQQLVASVEIDFDREEARHLPSPDEQIVSFDQLTRSAEALQRLKPNELRALWMKASGQSYNAIAEAQGWTYTKVNRLITEGRRAFLERYEEIETGEECKRWAPVVSALIDGEATAAMLVEARPHLRNCPACRATIRELRRTNSSLAIVLPIATAAVAHGHHEPVSGVAMRVYEALTGGLHERVAASAVKIQAGVEAASAGKVAAIVASAAAVAGGGIAVIKRDVTPRRHVQHAQRVWHTPAANHAPSHRTTASASAGAQRVIAASLPAPSTASHRARSSAPKRVAYRIRREFGSSVRHAHAAASARPRAQAASEFSSAAAQASAAPVVQAPTSQPAVPTSSGVSSGGEFGP